jgi:hypothetical protein
MHDEQPCRIARTDRTECYCGIRKFEIEEIGAHWVAMPDGPLHVKHANWLLVMCRLGGNHSHL